MKDTDNPYSLFALRQLESDLTDALARLDAKIMAHAKLSNEVDSLAAHVELLRHVIAVRRSNRVQWNGRPTRIEFVETN
jgi:hypothetical protein